MTIIEAQFPSDLSLTEGGVISDYVVLGQVSHGENEARITDLPAGTKTASVWITEDKNGHSHYGTIEFETKSVQLKGSTCRVYFRLKANPGAQWPVGAMVFVGG